MDGMRMTAEAPRPEQVGELKEARRFFSRLGLCFLAGAVVIFAVQLLAVRLLSMWKPELLEDANLILLATMVPMYLIGMPVLIFFVKRLPAQTPEKRRIRPGQFVLAVIMAFAAMYIMNLAGTVITLLISLLKKGAVQNNVALLTTNTNLLLVFVIAVVCAPVMEEYVFRKLIVDRAMRYGQGVAVVLSGLMFGFFHGNLNQFAYAAALGMFLAFLYVKTGELRITIAIHMMVNFVGGVVSVLVMKAANLEKLQEIGSGDMGTTMEYLSENGVGFLLYMLFGLFVIAVMITGFVLFVVFLCQKRFTFAEGEVRIPRGKRFGTVILNLGMMLYCLFWIGMMIRQLLL